MVDEAPGRSGFPVRLEWGPTGARAVVDPDDVVVVVDVLSFTTTLSVAVDRGLRVIPCAPSGGRPDVLAPEYDAVVAVPRARAGRDRISLSPVSVRDADPPRRDVVLPSPNGSALSSELARGGQQVLGACLRNRFAVARQLGAIAADATGGIVLVPAGERWPDGSLRPAIEDLWGAGAVVDALAEMGCTNFAPEAVSAAGAFRAVAAELPAALLDCVGGRELDGLGYRGDVAIAAELDHSDVVPILVDGAFRGRRPLEGAAEPSA